MCEAIRKGFGRIFLSSSTSIFKNLAYEEYLLRTTNIGEGGEVVFMWSNKPAVVVGRHQNPWLEANIPFLKEYNIDLARRHSGGGTVYHDRGNLNISILTTTKSHCRRRNLASISKALNARFAVDIVPTKRDDMELQPGSRKCSGTAARITREKSYHHLTLLIEADLMLLSAALKSPFRDCIRTNASRSVRAPAVGFLKQDDSSVEVHTARDVLVEHFASQFEECPVDEVDVDEEVVRNEQCTKILSDLTDWQWIFGKTPKFWFESGDTKQYVEAGIIKECSLGNVGKRFDPIIPTHRVMSEQI
nr:Biotin lipoate A B protein ligase domain containing protein [Haemonchus contortus]